MFDAEQEEGDDDDRPDNGAAKPPIIKKYCAWGNLSLREREMRDEITPDFPACHHHSTTHTRKPVHVYVFWKIRNCLLLLPTLCTHKTQPSSPCCSSCASRKSRVVITARRSQFPAVFRPPLLLLLHPSSPSLSQGNKDKSINISSSSSCLVGVGGSKSFTRARTWRQCQHHHRRRRSSSPPLHAEEEEDENFLESVR